MFSCGQSQISHLVTAFITSQSFLMIKVIHAYHKQSPDKQAFVPDWKEQHLYPQSHLSVSINGMNHSEHHHPTAVGQRLQRGPKCMLYKANMIPMWVETAGASVCGHDKPRSLGWWSPPAVPQHVPPRRSSTRVWVAMKWLNLQGAVVVEVVLEVDGNQVKSFRGRF